MDFQLIDFSPAGLGSKLSKGCLKLAQHVPQVTQNPHKSHSKPAANPPKRCPKHFQVCPELVQKLPHTSRQRALSARCAANASCAVARLATHDDCRHLTQNVCKGGVGASALALSSWSHKALASWLPVSRARSMRAETLSVPWAC